MPFSIECQRWRLLALLFVYPFFAYAMDGLTHSPEATDWRFYITSTAPWVDVLNRTDARDSDDAVQIVLLDRQIRLAPDGRLSRYIHLIQRINNASALRAAGTLEITVQPSYEQLDIHDYTIIRDGERLPMLDAGKVEILRQESDLNSSIYNGSLTVTQILEDLRVGDMIEYRYTIHGRNPVLGTRYSDNWNMGWELDVDYSRLRLFLPDEREFTIHADPSLPKAKVSRDDGMRVHTWVVRRHLGHSLPEDMPAWYFAQPRVEISEYTNWDEVAQWGQSLFEPALAQQINWPAAQAIISDKQLAAAGKAVALLNLVQQEIRYFGIETGVNALQPSSPLETLERRYGDCKDKSALLTRLLRQAGLTANSVLVSAQREKGILEQLPGPHVFDHAIVQAEIDGKTFWLDPTATHQGDALEHLGYIDYGVGLPLASDTQGLMIMRDPMASVTRLEVEQEFINDDDTLTMRIERKRRGLLAENLRASLKAAGKKEWNKAIHDYYIRLYSGLTASAPITHDDNIELNQYQTAQHYKFTEPLKLEGTYWQLETYADAVKDYTNLPRTLNRDEPLHWTHPIDVLQTIIVDNDEGLPEHDFEPVVVERQAFSYRRELEQDGDRLTIRHHYTSHSDYVQHTELSDHFAGLREVNEALSLYVYLNSPEQQRLNQRNDNLKNKLRNLLRKK